MKIALICVVVFVFLLYPFAYSMIVTAKKADYISDIAFRKYLRKKMDNGDEIDDK